MGKHFFMPEFLCRYGSPKANFVQELMKEIKSTFKYLRPVFRFLNFGGRAQFQIRRFLTDGLGQLFSEFLHEEISLRKV